jgi:outer membrane protein OmpA-like peptidoglycan-associated protein
LDIPGAKQTPGIFTFHYLRNTTSTKALTSRKERKMKRTRFRTAFRIIPAFAALLLLCCVATAQGQVKGAISQRSGATMTVKTQDSGDVIVLLTPATKVEETQGLFRHESMNVTSLVPGLFVQVKGSNNDQNQLVADTVKFHGSDLKAAVDSQAGLVPTEQKVAETQQEIKQSQAQIAAQQQVIKKQQAEIVAEKVASDEHAAEIAANKEAIAEANKRFGELDQYNILGEVTVLFGNNKVMVEPEYRPQLLQLAQQAVGIKGYMIQVKGYASKVGSRALNQRLSLERARNVTNFMEQQGNIPLPNILSPGAMGTSREVAPDTTSEGQAENRRVVVRILQNKGIAGP